ncbi:MAG: hypothetical protein WD688_07335 [Candidatus Binatia bacterium]
MYRRLIEWLRRNPIAQKTADLLKPETRRGIIRGLRGRDRAVTIKNALAGRVANPSVVDPQTHELALGRMADAEFETTFPIGLEGTRLAHEQLTQTIGPVLRPRSGWRPALAHHE